eukprot:1185851-Prorocentrum_minimum.AAC.1
MDEHKIDANKPPKTHATPSPRVAENMLGNFRSRGAPGGPRVSGRGAPPATRWDQRPPPAPASRAPLRCPPSVAPTGEGSPTAACPIPAARRSRGSERPFFFEPKNGAARPFFRFCFEHESFFFGFRAGPPCADDGERAHDTPETLWEYHHVTF